MKKMEKSTNNLLKVIYGLACAAMLMAIIAETFGAYATSILGVGFYKFATWFYDYFIHIEV